MDLTENQKKTVSDEKPKKENYNWFNLSNKGKRDKIDQLEEVQIKKRQNYINKNLDTINKVMDQMKFKIDYTKSNFPLSQITQYNRSNTLLRKVSERLFVSNKHSDTKINYSLNSRNEPFRNSVNYKKSDIKLPSLFNLTTNLPNLINNVENLNSSLLLKKLKTSISADYSNTKYLHNSIKSENEEKDSKKLNIKKMPKLEDVLNNIKTSSILPSQVSINFNDKKPYDKKNNLIRESSLKDLPNYKIATSISLNKLNFDEKVKKDIQKIEQIKLERKKQKSSEKKGLKKKKKGKKRNGKSQN